MQIATDNINILMIDLIKLEEVLQTDTARKGWVAVDDGNGLKKTTAVDNGVVDGGSLGANTKAGNDGLNNTAAIDLIVTGQNGGAYPVTGTDKKTSPAMIKSNFNQTINLGLANHSDIISQTTD